MNFLEEVLDLRLGYLALLEDLRVLAVKLVDHLVGVGVEDELVEQDGVDLLLLVSGPVLVEHADHGRGDLEHEACVTDGLPR